MEVKIYMASIRNVSFLWLYFANFRLHKDAFLPDKDLNFNIICIFRTNIILQIFNIINIKKTFLIYKLKHVKTLKIGT